MRGTDRNFWVRVTVVHHKACWVAPKWWNFLSVSQNYVKFFFLPPFWFQTFSFKVDFFDMHSDNLTFWHCGDISLTTMHTGVARKLYLSYRARYEFQMVQDLTLPRNFIPQPRFLFFENPHSIFLQRNFFLEKPRCPSKSTKFLSCYYSSRQSSDGQNTQIIILVYKMKDLYQGYKL